MDIEQQLGLMRMVAGLRAVEGVCDLVMTGIVTTKNILTEKEQSCYDCEGFGGTTDVNSSRQIRCIAHGVCVSDDGCAAQSCILYPNRRRQK